MSKTRSIKFLAASVSVAALALATPAYAQQDDEIIVTAQKRAQSIQDVSAAVTALDGEGLAEKQIHTILDLQSIAPSVSVGNDFAQAKIFIRGIGLDISFTGVDPSVALHVDGAVISQSFGQLGSFFDLERIEVLRGPQGTLYGRNATGGSFNLHTKKPTEEFEGYARVTAGNYSNVITEGAISGPIVSDKVLGRVAFRTENRAGFGENIVSGNDINNANKQSLRGHLQFNLSEKADFLLTGEYANEDDSALGLVFLEPLFPDTTNPNLVVVGEGFAPGERDVASDAEYQNDKDTWALTGTFNYDFNENFSLRSITNYRELDARIVQDLEVSRLVTPNTQDLNTISKHFSEELQLIYESDNLHGLVGFYYFQEDVDSTNQIGENPADDLVRVAFNGSLDIESFAAFANVTYDFNEQFSINLGARYSDENRRLFDNATVLPLIGDGLVLPFDDERSFDNFSIRVGAEYRPTDDILLYGNFSQGFKAGVAATGFLNPIVDPETVDAFEIGAKTKFADGRVLLNVSAFDYNFDDLQVGRTLPFFSTGFTNIIENAEGTSNKGIEVETIIHLTDNFTLDGQFGYLDATFDEYITGDPLTLDGAGNIDNIDVSGNQLTQAPKTTWRIGGTYETELSNGGGITLAADLSGKSKIYFTPFNIEQASQDATTFLNASIRYDDPDDRFSLTAWGKNLTDEFAFSSVFAVSTGRSFQATLQPPLTYGVTAGVKF